jgi:hypothetical protein
VGRQGRRGARKLAWDYTTSTLLSASIHPTSENWDSANFAFWAFSEVQHRVRLESTHAKLVAFGYHARESRSDLTHECCGEERYTHG